MQLQYWQLRWRVWTKSSLFWVSVLLSLVTRKLMTILLPAACCTLIALRFIKARNVSVYVVLES